MILDYPSEHEEITEGRQEGQTRRCDNRIRERKEVRRWRKEPRGQECRQPLEAGKGQGADLSQLPGRTHLNFRTSRLSDNTFVFV